MADNPGTSQFTHRDDLTAPVHTTNPDHHEAHVYGGEVVPKKQLETVILGPPAFGSPDPRTLGHIMMPLDEPPASAPKLDEAFLAIQETGGRPEEYLTEDDLQGKSREELVALAGQFGVNVDSTDSNEEIINKLFEEKGENNPNPDGSEGTQTPTTPPTPGGETPNYEEMSKPDLLQLAQQRNIGNVNAATSKDDLISALENSDAEQNTTENQNA